MKIRTNDRWARILLAALPSLAAAPRFESAWRLGIVTAAFFWVTVFLFRRIRFFFPERLQDFALIVWIAWLVQMTQYFRLCPPSCGVSLFLLLYSLNFKEQSAGLAENFWTGLSFFLFFSALGFVQERLSLTFYLFDEVSGTFFLLALFAIFWAAGRSILRKGNLIES